MDNAIILKLYNGHISVF